MAAESFIPKDSALYQSLAKAAEGVRCLVLSGLPGIGKSLLTRQTGLIARSHGRDVTLMQWDTVRAAFERHPAGQGFADIVGVAHPVIRIAADAWARTGLARWLAAARAESLIIIEAPLIGGRMVSLARPTADAAEAVLAGETLFLLPVPTRAVKDALRNRRRSDEERDASHPFATVDVLDGLVREINAIAVAIGAVASAPADYDPVAYAAVYLHAMRHRRAEQISIDRVFDISAVPVDDAVEEIVPTDMEMASALEAAARLPNALSAKRLATWYS